jgi:hypothetical protein
LRREHRVYVEQKLNIDEGRKEIVLARLSLVAVIVLALSSLVTASQPPTVVVSLEPSTVTASEEDVAEIRLVITSATQSVYAGEFNLTYPSEVNVTVMGTKNWTVFRPTTGGLRYAFYRNPGVNISDRSVVAVMKVKAAAGNCTISLAYLKAAGSSGEDLAVVYGNQAVSVTVVAAVRESERPQPVTVTTVERRIDWKLISFAATLLTAVILAAYYFYSWPSAQLLIDGRKLRLRGGNVVLGREDFAGMLPPDRLPYITRKVKGGHFRIVRYGRAYYIQDLGSTNGTFVNGVDIRGKGPVPIKQGDVIEVPNAFQARFSVR